MFFRIPEVNTLLRWYINYAYFYRVIPYHWTKGKSGMEFAPIPKGSLWTWRNVKILLALHQIYLILRICQSYYAGSVPISLRILEILYLLCYSLVSVFHCALTYQGGEVLHLFNHYLECYKMLTGN